MFASRHTGEHQLLSLSVILVLNSPISRWENTLRDLELVPWWREFWSLALSTNIHHLLSSSGSFGVHVVRAFKERKSSCCRNPLREKRPTVNNYQSSWTVDDGDNNFQGFERHGRLYRAFTLKFQVFYIFGTVPRRFRTKGEVFSKTKLKRFGDMASRPSLIVKSTWAARLLRQLFPWMDWEPGSNIACQYERAA